LPLLSIATRKCTSALRAGSRAAKRYMLTAAGLAKRGKQRRIIE
jgi:hypothetical protein